MTSDSTALDKDKSTWTKGITLDGEVDIEVKPDGQKLYYPLKTLKMEVPPVKFKICHYGVMALFHDILTYIKKHHPTRKLPVTRREFTKSGGEDKLLKDLIDLGMLQSCHIPTGGTDGINRGSRICYYYTDLGRAYIRLKIDPTYAITDNTGETQNG